MSEKTPEQQEIESLRTHNAELLADLKKVRKKVTELTEQVEALSGERDSASAELQKIQLDGPVAAMLERVSMLPEYFLNEFKARGYQFQLEDGEVVIRDSEGAPAMVGETAGGDVTMREAKFTEADVRDLVLEDWLPKEKKSPHVARFESLVIGSRASGGGAGGSSSGGSLPRSPTKTAERLNTGLR
ncbi:hypothetical protein [Microbulbifer magnicolonia]|uniref:hypothetical protein n=1 Tax=Microbulbifer magnicolonia TaxID=3109744 RepID=UPI002B40C00B|nr:hypothetical protein [Microbulbifer sp. GG15]